MQKDNLLEQLPPELIPFIVKDLSNQDLKKCHSINDIWQSEANLEWSKRKTLFDFRTMSLVQDENTVKDFIRSWKSVTRVSAIVKNSLNAHY